MGDENVFLTLPSFFKVKEMSDTYLTGTVDNDEQLEEVMERYNRSSVVSFVQWGPVKKDGEDSRIVWLKSLDHGQDGKVIPGLLIGKMEKKCIHAIPPRNKSRIKKENAECFHDHDYEKRPGLCHAKITIRRVAFYRDFAMDSNSAKRHRRETMADLKVALASNKVTKETIIRIMLPMPAAHSNHNFVVDNDCWTFRHVDQGVKNKLYEYVRLGHTSATVVQSMLRQYVQDRGRFDEGLRPAASDKKYYPSKSTIEFHVRQALKRCRHMEDAQDNPTVPMSQSTQDDSGTEEFPMTWEEDVDRESALNKMCQGTEDKLPYTFDVGTQAYDSQMEEDARETEKTPEFEQISCTLNKAWEIIRSTLPFSVKDSATMNPENKVRTSSGVVKVSHQDHLQNPSVFCSSEVSEFKGAFNSMLTHQEYKVTGCPSVEGACPSDLPVISSTVCPFRSETDQPPPQVFGKPTSLQVKSEELSCLGSVLDDQVTVASFLKLASQTSARLLEQNVITARDRNNLCILSRATAQASSAALQSSLKGVARYNLLKRDALLCNSDLPPQAKAALRQAPLGSSQPFGGSACDVVEKVGVDSEKVNAPVHHPVSICPSAVVVYTRSQGGSTKLLKQEFLYQS